MGAQDQKITVGSTATAVEFRDELQPGTRLLNDLYEIRDFLGADGFGITYLAADSSDRHLVIKECFPGAFCRRRGTSVQPRSPGHEVELTSIVRLFAEEARNLSTLGHPNVVGIREVFEENRTAYIAMDFVNGRDMMEMIQDDAEPLTPKQIRGYLDKMLDAVGFVHRRGMLHRDISPNNIIVTPEDEPVLIDFGAAREQATKTSRILSVLRVVKDGYSPQEFYLSGSEQGPSCDLYSLAACFYHIITGRLPPGSQKRLAARASGQTDPYVPLAEMTTQYDDRFCAALDKAISIVPEDRFQSAEEWIAALRPEPEVTAPPAEPVAGPRRVMLREQHSDRPDATGDEADLLDAMEDKDSWEDEPFPSEMRGDEIYDDLMAEAPPRRGAGRLFFAGAAIAAAAAAGLFVVPMLPGQQDTLDALVFAPTLVAPEVSSASEIAVAGFAEVARSAVPGLYSADGDAAPHGITPGIQAAPEFFGTRTAESDVEAPVPAVPDAVALFDPAEIEAAIEEDVAAPIVAPSEIAVQPAAREAVATVSPHPEATFRRFVAAPLPASAGDTGVAGIVVTSAAPVLSFSADLSDPGLIGDVAGDAPSWIASGLRVTSVDGVPVETVDEATAILAAKAAPNATDVTGSLGVSDRDGVVTYGSLTVPVVHNTRFPNGLELESRFEDGAWVIRVSAAPDNGSLAVGDVMIGLVRTSQRTESPEAVRQIVETELSEGRTGLAFAVGRDGLMWVETYALPPS